MGGALTKLLSSDTDQATAEVDIESWFCNFVAAVRVLLAVTCLNILAAMVSSATTDIHPALTRWRSLTIPLPDMLCHEHLVLLTTSEHQHRTNYSGFSVWGVPLTGENLRRVAYFLGVFAFTH